MSATDFRKMIDIEPSGFIAVQVIDGQHVELDIFDPEGQVGHQIGLTLEPSQVRLFIDALKDALDTTVG